MLQNTNGVIKYDYNGTEITFQHGANVMVNATEMAKPFDKQPYNWLRTQQTQEFIKELSATRKCVPTDLVLVRNGGDNYGTWMHEDVAMEFARWLSPKFAIWCNDRIKELLTQGVTTINDDDATIEKAMDILHKRLEQSRAEAQRLQMQNDIQDQQLRIQAPKVEYHDKVLASQSTYNTTQIAKEFGWGAVTLNKKLQDLGIQYKQHGQWLLYAKYQDKGYTKTVTHCFTNSNGETSTEQRTVWTEAGRKFIHSALKA